MNAEERLRDPILCHSLLERLRALLGDEPMRFMEVCGTHTVAIFQSGLAQLLPANLTHLSGPGCPVCVTHDSEVAAFLELAENPEVLLATFGDLLRVPGPEGKSLKHAHAHGAQINIVYSPMEALTLAENHPQKTVVFLGIGFETTAPAVAATLLQAKERKLGNFTVLSLHKLVPPVLKTLLDDSACQVDAFLLPGHVSTVIGLAPYAFLARDYQVPGVVSGFEPADILLALCELAKARKEGRPCVRNAYPRGVDDMGNPRACALMEQVFEPKDALWRGLGRIPESGLKIRSQYADFDACERFALTFRPVKAIAGCRCGEVLKGAITPADCPLFGRRCTPQAPVGPCMVSTEGSCAAWYKYVGLKKEAKQ
ncbi:MAG: hydrogenase formation protein HypD [Desulfovibrio sp.]|nr:hydrogenase formation protein HypD [Desulfovibrio sp.]